MKTLQLAAAAVTAFIANASAKELQPNPLTSQIYDSGSVHEELMSKKMVKNTFQSQSPRKAC